MSLPRRVKGGQAAAMAAYDDGLLAVLRDDWPVPLSTRQVAERAGDAYWPPDAKTGRRLRALRQAGWVERETVEGWRWVYWRLAAPPPALDLPPDPSQVEP